MAEALLKLSGSEYRGWTELSVESGIEQASGAFTLSVTETFPGHPDKWPIKTGMACQVLLDGTVAITGCIDKVQRSLSATSSAITTSGRDRTADIIDSSAVLPGTIDKTGQLNNISLPDLARLLCKPHGINVRVAAGLDIDKPFSLVSIDPGDTVWECLARYARQRAVLIMSDSWGGLIITRAGTAYHPAALVEGQNILNADFTDDISQRFCHYLALGQADSSDDFPAEVALHPAGTAEDKTIRGNRRQLLLAETLADGVTLTDRAAFECNMRIASGKQLSIAVQGFSEKGVLWQPNQRVAVKMPRWGLVGTFLIQKVVYSQGTAGSKSQLTLVPPGFYQRLAEADAKHSASDTVDLK